MPATELNDVLNPALFRFYSLPFGREDALAAEYKREYILESFRDSLHYIFGSARESETSGISGDVELPIPLS